MRYRLLVRTPDPIAYFVNVSKTQDQGFRANSQLDQESAQISVGGSFDHRRHNFASTVDILRSRQGVPGSISDPDPDDEFLDEFVIADIGYQLRRDFDDRIMVRGQVGIEHSRSGNAIPFGLGLNDRDLSLINVFGLDFTNLLYDVGLFDGTGIFGLGADDPTFLFGAAGPFFGAAGPFFGLAPLANNLPDRVDFNPILSFDTWERRLKLQFRHLLDIGLVEFTYGAEWSAAEFRNKLRSNVLAFRGVAAIGDAINPFLFFPFVTAVPTTTSETSQTVALAYTQGRWIVSPDSWVETGFFIRHFDSAFIETETNIDPRFGLAWQPLPKQWLRIAGQRELILPVRTADTLAPVATVGIVAADASVFEGGVSTDYQLRWDAEWSPWLFTFARLEKQEIDAFGVTNPLSQFALVALDRARVDTARARCQLVVPRKVWALDPVPPLLERQRVLWRQSRSRRSAGPGAYCQFTSQLGPYPPDSS